MILTAPSPCLPSAATVQQLFSVARDADIIPDISLDPVLTTFLSLDSAAALQHRYGFLQRGMSGEQQAAFHLNLTAQMSSSRVTNGGVGVVALALSLLFDQVAQHVRAAVSPRGSEVQKVFGVSASSRIGSMIHGYLRLVPAIANNEEKMAEAAELYDAWLNLELIDHYERMTTKKRMSTEAMRQWLAGAAFHLHLRIHQVRLHSVPSGSIESLRLSYKTGLNRLVSGYVAYLRKNILETEAGGTLEPKRSSGDNSSVDNSSVDNSSVDNSSGDNSSGDNSSVDNSSVDNSSGDNSSVDNSSGDNSSGDNSSVDNSSGDNSSGDNSSGNVTALPADAKANSTAGDQRSCGQLVGTNASAAPCFRQLGLLVIEPQREVSHGVRHRPCESAAIQDALVTRIMKAQDLQRNRNFFLYPEKVLRGLLRQRQHFELRANRTEANGPSGSQPRGGGGTGPNLRT